MKISVVSTLYYSTNYIDEFYTRVCAVIDALKFESYEIIFVNDGSPDNSCDHAIAIAKQDPNVVVVDLSRNFGHHKAMMTGLSYAKGDYVYLIDSDLEEEPEWLVSFYEVIQAQSADVVYGMQQVRRGKLLEQVSGAMFYKLMDIVSRSDYPRDVVTARFMTQPYVAALISHHEREIFIVNLWHITGFNQIAINVKKHSTSPSTYTLKKKINHLINAVTSYEAPLMWIFYVGFSISISAFLAVLILVINWLVNKNTLTGWTSLVVSIWCVGGIIITALGFIGVYLSMIYLEVKQRPITIVRDVFRF